MTVYEIETGVGKVIIDNKVEATSTITHKEISFGKCRGCGKPGVGMIAEGVGPMHYLCEIKRLAGLLTEQQEINKEIEKAGLRVIDTLGTEINNISRQNLSLRSGIQQLITMRREQLRQLCCQDCDDKCDHGESQDTLIKKMKSLLEE